MSGVCGGMRARALWMNGPRSLEIRDEAAPTPGPGEARVQTIASGISAGTEMLVYRGQVDADLPLDLPTLDGSFAFPIKYGYAAVGRVIDTGPGVVRPAPGDLVFALHPHQTAFTIAAAALLPLPAGLSPVAGLFAANVETAVNAVLDAAPRLGEMVAVFGQGTVGLLIAALLKRAGAAPVIAIDPFPRRRAAALEMGADLALAPEAETAARLRALTDGRGVDIAVEVSGSPATLQAAIDAVADEGTVLVVSWYGTKVASLELGGRFHRGRIHLRSSQVGRLDPALAPRWDHARRSALVASLLPQLGLERLVSHRLPFERAAEGYQLLDERPGEALQVALVYDGASERRGASGDARGAHDV